MVTFIAFAAVMTTIIALFLACSSSVASTRHLRDHAAGRCRPSHRPATR